MKRCPIAAKIAGSIAILPCCVLKVFSHRGINVCPICEASLSHYTLYARKFGSPVSYFPVGQKKRRTKKRVTAPILQEIVTLDIVIGAGRLVKFTTGTRK